MRFDHVAILVADLEGAIKLWCDVLGGEVRQAAVDVRGVTGVQLDLGADARVELITPGAEDGAVLAQRLEDRGEGLHHITVMSSDLKGDVMRLESFGYQIVAADFSDPHWQEAFISPNSANGVLVQLAQSDLDREGQDAYFGQSLNRLMDALHMSK